MAKHRKKALPETKMGSQAGITIVNQVKPEFTIRFWRWKARENAEHKAAPIVIRSTQNAGGKQLTWNTGIRFRENEWHAVRGEPRIPRGLTGQALESFRERSDELVAIRERLTARYRELRRNDPTARPTLADITARRGAERSAMDLASLCQAYATSTKYSPGQRHAASTVKTNLIGYQKDRKLEPLHAEDMTPKRLEDFFDYLTEQEVQNNSQYKRWRTLRNVAKASGVLTPEIDGYELGYDTSNGIKYRLTYEQVKTVTSTKTKTELEKVAKSLFLLCCFTGMRVGDAMTLEKGKLNTLYYERLQGKTKAPVRITVHPRNEQLLKAHLEGIHYSRQQLSAALKEVLKRGGISETFRRYVNVGHNTVEEKMPAYESISFHAGRHFYARLLADLGLGEEIIAAELGHSKRSVTQHYMGNQALNIRIVRVRAAIKTMDRTMEELSRIMAIAV